MILDLSLDLYNKNMISLAHRGVEVKSRQPLKVLVAHFTTRNQL